MNELEQKTITSMEVAEMVNKNHADLLRDIKRYVSQMTESKIALSEFFKESTYKDSTGRTLPCYNVTKKGCEFIAHKLTGVKGTEFTAKYINKFHDMEEEIRKPRTALEQLQLTQQAVLEVNEKIESVDKDLQDFKQDMPILGIEESRITTALKKVGIQCLGGKYSNAYKDKSLRGKVYSDIYNQLKREFGVASYKAIKRSQCDIAIEIIEGYKVPFALSENIRNFNAQEVLKECV